MRNFYSIGGHFSFLILLILLIGSTVWAISDGPYIAFSAGTAQLTSGNSKINISFGQTVTGLIEAPNGSQLNLGFWQNFDSDNSGCCDMAGDFNNDGAVNILDIVGLINYKYKNGPPPACLDEADATGNGIINILDAVYLINFKYKGGPGPICGTIG